MSKRADLKARIHTLGEIKSILSAMKNLSIIEMNKVSRYLGAQNELALTIEEALGDFERFFYSGRRRREDAGADALCASGVRAWVLRRLSTKRFSSGLVKSLSEGTCR